MNEILEFDLAEQGVTTQYIPYALVLTPTCTKIALQDASTTASALTLDADTAPWVFAATRKLEALGALKRNWDSHGALPISPGARAMTFDALGWLKRQDLPIPAVVLGSAGTVHLEWRSRGKKLEIGFDDCGTIEYLKIDQAGNWDEGENVNEDVRNKLVSLAAWLRNS